MAYVDNDAVVLSHLDAVVEGDVRDADTILRAVARDIDLDEPACLIMGSLLHFFAPQDARDLVARYTGALAPGSYLILTIGLASGEAAEAFFRRYNEGPIPLYQHTPEDFASFFGSLELVPPGIADASTSRPGVADIPAAEPREGWMTTGIARIG